MDRTVIIIISLMGTLLFVLLMGIFMLLVMAAKKGKKNKKDCETNPRKGNGSAADSKSYAKQDEYEKTVVLRSGNNTAKPALNKTKNERIEIEEVSKLTETEKTELLHKPSKNDLNETVKLEEADNLQTSFAMLRHNVNGKDIEYDMSTEIITIGRDPQLCDVVIENDKFVGKQHAIIYRKKGRYFLVDLNSKNGSFVHNDRIKGLIELSGDCTIKLANTQIGFAILK